MAPAPYNPRRHPGKRLLSYTALSLLLLLFGSALFGGVFSWLGARFSDLLYGTGAFEEEAQMREILAELMLENASLREDAIKAERYRNLLGMTRTSRSIALAGLVLYRTEGLTRGNLIIDRGSRDGVVRNSVCVSPDGLVGVVSVVEEAQCEVLTLESPQVHVSCITYPSGAVGILRTSPSGDLELVDVDLSENVAPGDKVLTSRYGGIYPDGLLVGDVIEVRVAGREGLAQTLLVEAATDLSRVSEVLLLIPEDR